VINIDVRLVLLCQPLFGIPHLGRFGAGRPLGHLVAWLSAGNEFSNADGHKAFVPSFEQRRASRASLRALPNSEIWLARERAVRDGEAFEPE